ncbi:hypothetical protein Hanom_Chr01g00001131 [Helianthus anomalus]
MTQTQKSCREYIYRFARKNSFNRNHRQHSIEQICLSGNMQYYCPINHETQGIIYITMIMDLWLLVNQQWRLSFSAVQACWLPQVYQFFLIPSVLGSDESHVTSRKLSMTVGLVFISPRLQVSYYMVNSKTKVVFGCNLQPGPSPKITKKVM